MKRSFKRVVSFWAAFLMMFNVIIPTGAMAADSTRAGVGAPVIQTPTNDTNFRSILGNAVYYALVLENFNRQNHVQANFAAKYYHENSQAGVEPDLAGNAGQIIIAHPETKYNVNGKPYVIRMGSTTSGAQTGKVTLFAGDVVNNDYHNIIDENIDHSTYDYLTAIPSKSSELESTVEALLKKGDNSSASLLGEKPKEKFETVSTDKYRGQSSVTLDYLQYNFPDDATIYVNGDNLLSALNETSGLKIAKKPGQTIVFNFYEAKNVTLKKIQVKYNNGVQFSDNEYDCGEAGTSFSPSGKGPKDKAKNTWLATLAEHLVWNMPKAEKVTLQTTTGIFLIPKNKSTIETKETSSGWLISRGTFTNTGSAEWHGIYGGMPSSTSLNLVANKRIDNRNPKGNEKFRFLLERYTKENGWKNVKEVTNSNGNVAFEDIKDLGNEWNIFRITETGKDPSTTGNYLKDNSAYYAVVRVHKDDNGIITWSATAKYFKEIDQKNKDSDTLIFTPELFDETKATMSEALGDKKVTTNSIYLKSITSKYSTFIN